MLLRRLKIKNIATYKECEIDFTRLAYPVFVTGKTGAGKTTLLVDAILAALFRMPYGTKEPGALREFVMAGKGRGVVELEFEVDGRAYRVVRTISSTGSSTAQLLDESGKLIASGRSVDSAIRELLGYESDSIVNSVVVRQGDVQPIIDASNSARRDILLKIMGFDFRKLRERVKRRMEFIAKELGKREGVLEEIKRESKRKAEIREEISKLEAEIPELERKKAEVEEKLREVSSQEEELAKKVAEKEKEREEVERLRKKIERLNKERQQKLTEMARLRRALAGIPKLPKDVEEVRRAYSRLLEIQKDITQLESELRRLKEVERMLSELKEVRDRISELEGAKRELEEILSELEELRREEARVSQEIESVREHAMLLEGAEARCPVCGAPLTEEAKERRLRELRKRIAELESEAARIRGRIAELEERGEELRKKVSLLDVLRGKEESLASMVESSGYSEERKAEVEGRLGKLREEARGLEEFLKRELGARSVGEVKGILRRISEAEDVRRRMEALQAEADAKMEVIQELRRELARREELLRDFVLLKRTLQSVRERRQSLERERESLLKRLSEIGGRISELERKLAEIAEREREVPRIEADIAELRVRHEALRLLDEAFKESGFPVYLLEHFLQSISDYANDFLREFGMNIEVSLSITKERGTTGVAIQLFHNGESRNPKTFSGGEKTLIGFAVRLGIGRAIAEEFATKSRPRFLIIDEGFGMLDETLRQKLADVLGSLYSTGEYEQIIVISHHEELKSNPVFGTVIEVSKDEEGFSTIRIHGAEAEA